MFLVDYDTVNDNILLFDTNGKQLVNREDQLTFFAELRKRSVKIIAPAMPALLAVNGRPRRALAAREGPQGPGLRHHHLDLRARRPAPGARRKAGFYYDFDPTGAAIKKDSDMYKALDVLAREVKILGIFSDWPATVTYYANCMGLE